MMKRKIVAGIIGVLASVGLITTIAQPASASTINNNLCVSAKGSNTNPVKVINEGFVFYNIYRGHCSTEYQTVKNRVQAFMIHPNDSCTSIWGYHYPSGEWVFFKTSGNTLTLICSTIYK